MSYIRLFLYTTHETYHLYLGIAALDKLGINFSSLEKLESWGAKSNAEPQQTHEHIHIFDNKNNEVVFVGESQTKPLPHWLKEWLEVRGYHIPTNGFLKTISEETFANALNNTEIYYFGRNHLATEAA